MSFVNLGHQIWAQSELDWPKMGQIRGFYISDVSAVGATARVQMSQQFLEVPNCPVILHYLVYFNLFSLVCLDKTRLFQFVLNKTITTKTSSSDFHLCDEARNCRK